MVLGVDDELQTDLMCRNETLKNSKIRQVLCVTIDNRLNFRTHLLNTTKNANLRFNEKQEVKSTPQQSKKSFY